MDNLSALRGLCNAICNTFYPDRAAMEMMLFNEQLGPCDDAKPKDIKLLKLAIRLVKGYVEASRSENGVSTSVNTAAIDDAIKDWCVDYGLDADDYILSQTTIEDGSNRW